MTDEHVPKTSPTDLTARLEGRRIRERLLHASYYMDRSPEEGVLLGLALSLAAARSNDPGT